MNTSEKQMLDLEGIVRANSEILGRMRRAMAQIAEIQARSSIPEVRGIQKGGPKN